MTITGPDVKGESQDSKYKDAIPLYSFSWGASNPTSVAHGGAGLASGKVSISSFNIMKKTDVASTALFTGCCKGTHYASAKVILRKASGSDKALDFLVIDFKEVMVESIQWSGSAGGDDTPTESVSFAFGEVTITYTSQDAKGGAGKPVVGKWDILKNIAA
ncbi:MAG: Hcp family type VI secretion system effector [Gemmatimonadales bacterium]